MKDRATISLPLSVVEARNAQKEAEKKPQMLVSAPAAPAPRPPRPPKRVSEPKQTTSKADKKHQKWQAETFAGRVQYAAVRVMSRKQEEFSFTPPKHRIPDAYERMRIKSNLRVIKAAIELQAKHGILEDAIADARADLIVARMDFWDAGATRSLLGRNGEEYRKAARAAHFAIGIANHRLRCLFSGGVQVGYWVVGPDGAGRWENIRIPKKGSWGWADDLAELAKSPAWVEWRRKPRDSMWDGREDEKGASEEIRRLTARCGGDMGKLIRKSVSGLVEQADAEDKAAHWIENYDRVKRRKETERGLGEDKNRP